MTETEEKILIEEDTFTFQTKRVKQTATLTFMETTLGESMDFADEVAEAKGADKTRRMIKFYQDILVESKSDLAGHSLEEYFRKMTPSELVSFSKKYQGLFVRLEKK